VVSDREADLFLKHVSSSAAIEVIPNCVDLNSYGQDKDIPRPFSMIFAGSFTYEPNYEAMCWFVQNVYPEILRWAPQAQLIITGNHAGKSLPLDDHVTLTGFVEDVRPLISRAWCAVIPLHKGGGTRLKILEAMALGTPVVATLKGAEGLEVTDGKELLIADDPHAFAQAILNLFLNSELRQRLARNAFELVRTRYDWSVVFPKFLAIVQGIGKV
jgi:glycosyltransferase involved in cell wall biosynthesis